MADFSERMASLNTQMRFKRYKDAMPIAYQLRLDLQLAQPTPKLLESLKIVEDVIEELERSKVSSWSKFVKKVRHTIDPSSREDEPDDDDDDDDEDSPEESGEKTEETGSGH